MLKINKKKFGLSLLLLSLSCLSSCAAELYNHCPAYPVAGEKVAAELAAFEGEAFWEWMGRINKLRLQLELCSNQDI